MTTNTAPSTYGYGAKKRSRSLSVRIKSCLPTDYVVNYERTEGRKVVGCSLSRYCELDEARLVPQQSFWELADVAKACEKLGEKLVKM